MEAEAGGRGLQIATAVLLGLISVVTAFGVLQATAWTLDAESHALDANDARDQGISQLVLATDTQRYDRQASIEARRYADQQDAAIAAGDLPAALYLGGAADARLVSTSTEFQTAWLAWRESGYDPALEPLDDPEYLAALLGGVDALAATARVEDALEESLLDRSTVFGQAALIHALALFLIGVSGINQLRLARLITLGVGATVFAAGLLLMTTAY